MPTVITRATYATFDTVPTATPAWNTLNVLELLKPAPKRTVGGVVLPGATGRRARKIYDDGTERTLLMQFFGDRDREGLAHPNLRQGIEANLEYFMTNVVEAPANPTSTRTCVLTLPSGATWSGPVQILSLDWADDTIASVWNATLTLFIPRGRLVKD